MQAKNSDGEQSVPSSGSRTQQAYLCSGRMTDFSRLSRSGMTFKRLTDALGAELLTWYLGDFLVKIYRQQEEVQESVESAVGCGHTWLASLGRYDPDTHSLRTAQCSLFEDSIESSVTLPRWGMMRDGECLELPMWERLTKEIEYGLWATPTVNGNYNRKGLTKTSGDGLATQVKKWPTPTAHNAKETAAPSEARRNTPTLASQPGGKLNPDWVEKLMGWPEGWTSLGRISHVKMCFWLMGFIDGKENRTREVMRVLRKGHASEEIRESSGRLFSIYETAILLSQVCEHAKRANEARIFMACAETLKREVRGLRVQSVPSCPSYRSRYKKQRKREHTNLVQALPQLLAHYGKASWQDGGWEDAVPRVRDDVPHRMDRLKAIGNGQVPQCAAEAWRRLTGVV